MAISTPRGLPDCIDLLGALSRLEKTDLFVYHKLQ